MCEDWWPALTRNQRADLFAEHDTLQIVRLEQVENYDRHLVVHAKRESGRVHHTELFHQRVAVADLVVSLPLRPRKILPPPTTMTTWTPRSRTSPIWRAMSWIASGQMPTPASPPSASPLSLSRMRRYFGLCCLVMKAGGASGKWDVDLTL